MEITDFNASELDVYARCTESHRYHYNEPPKGLVIAESPMVIEAALDAGCIPVSFLVEKTQLNSAARVLIERCKDVPVYVVELDVLTKLTGFKMTRGMLCAMYRPDLLTVDQVCHQAKRLVVLENVMNPTNVGAIFRSAAALGMDGILLTGGCSDPLYRRSIRVSMGTVFKIPWTFLDKKQRKDQSWISLLQKEGFRMAAMALDEESISVADQRLTEEEKLAIVLGTEGYGLMEETISSCDYTVKIPMSNGVDSLNVAAASAVVFWQLSKKEK